MKKRSNFKRIKQIYMDSVEGRKGKERNDVIIFKDI